MFDKVKKVAGSVTGKIGAVVGLCVAAAQSAHAALSAEIGTGLTLIQTDALALVDLVWPVVAALTAAFIMFKIFKRGANKI